MKRTKLSASSSQTSNASKPSSSLKTSSSETKSIKSFFAAQVKRQEREVPCPVCNRTILYKNINNHLDGCTEIISPDDAKIIEDKGDDDLQTSAGNSAHAEPGKKRKHDEEKDNVKRQRKDSETFSDDETFLSDVAASKDVGVIVSSQDSCSSLKENCIPNCTLDASPLQVQSQSQTEERETLLTGCKAAASSPTIKLSPSLSYNPAKYGGLEKLSTSGAKIVRSSSKTAADRFSPGRRTKSSPSGSGGGGGSASSQNGTQQADKNGAKRKLFDEHPDLPQHDPFTPTKRRDPNYVPYYVTNFEYIITCVIDCTDDRDLFNSEELSIIEAYRKLPLSARKLYVRLFNRKHAWILASNIKYDECPDVEADAKTLVDSCLLQDKNQLEDLVETLTILHSPEIRIIAKEFNVNTRLSNTKAEIIEEMVKMCGKKTIFQISNTLKTKVVKRARSLGGNCYKLSPAPRSVLNRVLCLWGVAQWWGEREDDRPPSSLTTLLLANQGRLTYPPYTINRVRKVFRDREDLLLFEAAVKIEDQIEAALANKDFDAGYEVYKQTLAEFERQLGDESLMGQITNLPVFLRKLTAPAVLVYALNRCVDLLEKSKRHAEAVALLQRLISTDFLHKYRGLWYERLCLDLDNHLKQPKIALDHIKTALKDKYVRGGRRLSLHQRVIKICKAKKNSELENHLSEFKSSEDWQDPGTQDLKSVVISGKMISKDGVSGTKSVFVVTDAEGGTTYCNVEELVREHYKREGLYEGSHAEGAVLNSILGLLFWNIIYSSEVPDAFRDPAQSQPLDWDTDDFYLNRRDLIDQRIRQLEEMSMSGVCEELEVAYETYQGASSLVYWDLWRSLDHLLSLVKCLSSTQLARIMERMIKDHRTYRSGLPDLTCWNPETRTLKFVEVKGPGDRLSYKQILWIRFFCSIGVNSEVCHVDPTGSLESRGFKSSPTKSPIKKSPIGRRKQAKTGKKSQTGNPASGAAKRRKSNLADDELDFEDCLGATSDKSQATTTLERKPRGRRRKD